MAKSKEWINLCKIKYALELLDDAIIFGCKLAKTPMDQNLKLSKYEENKLNNPGTYRRLVGRLLYLTITRPNITFAIHRLSQFMAKTRLPIYKLPIEFCNTSRALLVRVCCFHVSQSFTLKPLLMQTGLHAPILEDQP